MEQDNFISKEEPITELNHPLISIITVVFNGEKTIKKSIESVVNQSYQNIEYIIIDGGSTDNTINIIRSYNEKIFYWISEVDNGIYDAMNKGVKASNGEWLFFLGCDDYLISNQTINSFLGHITEDLMMIFGNVIYSDGYCFNSSLDARVMISNSVHHQSCLYRSVIFDNFLYDVSNKVCADYELNLLLFLNKQKFRYINETISFCQTGGISSVSRKIAIIEINSIRRKYVGTVANVLLSYLYSITANIAELKQLITK